MSKQFTTRTLGAVAALSAGWLASSPAVAQDAKPAEPEKKKGWESVAAAGVSLTRGNSETFLATIGVNSQRKWAKDEVLLGASAGFGENTTTDANTGDETYSKTDQYVKGFGQYNHLFTERFYGGLRLDAINDSIAGIDYRLTISPIAGYYLIKKANTTLAVEAGPGIVFENLADRDSEQYITLRLAERFEHKFNERAKIWQSAEYLPRFENFGDYTFIFELGASALITKSVDLRVVFQDTYRSEPSAGRKQNDMKLIAGVGYRF